MTNFNGGTVVLGKGSWWIAYSLQGGGTATLVEGTPAQVKSWSQKKYGKSVQFPGTSVNINPISGAGFGGASTAIIIGPFTSKAQAESEAASGDYSPGVGASGNEASVAQAIPGLQQVGTFFSDLTQRNTWIRVFKIVAGFVLVIIGVAHLVGAGNVVAAAAKTVP